MRLLAPISKSYDEEFMITIPDYVKIIGMSTDFGRRPSKYLGLSNKLSEIDLEKGRFVKLKGYIGKFKILDDFGLVEGVYQLKLIRDHPESNYSHKIPKIKEFFG